MTKHFNQREQLEKRRLLREATPTAEAILWGRVRNRQVADLKFRRQYSVGPFVLDFYCAEIKLAVEIDGSSHDGAEADYDDVRQRHIETFGIRFLHFRNEQIWNDLEGVLKTIEETAAEIRK